MDVVSPRTRGDKSLVSKSGDNYTARATGCTETSSSCKTWSVYTRETSIDNAKRALLAGRSIQWQPRKLGVGQPPHSTAPRSSYLRVAGSGWPQEPHPSNRL